MAPEAAQAAAAPRLFRHCRAWGGTRPDPSAAGVQAAKNGANPLCGPPLSIASARVCENRDWGRIFGAQRMRCRPIGGIGTTCAPVGAGQKPVSIRHTGHSAPPTHPKTRPRSPFSHTRSRDTRKTTPPLWFGLRSGGPSLQQAGSHRRAGSHAPARRTSSAARTSAPRGRCGGSTAHRAPPRRWPWPRRAPRRRARRQPPARWRPPT